MIDSDSRMLAPLASMEDISQVNTPLPTPGHSPRAKHRWSHRSSLGIIMDEDETEEEGVRFETVPEESHDHNNVVTERETDNLLEASDNFTASVTGLFDIENCCFVQLLQFNGFSLTQQMLT